MAQVDAIGEDATGDESKIKDKTVASQAVSAPQGPFRGQPHWLPRLSVIFIAMIGLAGSIWLMRQLSWFLAPVFLGLNLVIAAYPVYSWLRRKGCPKIIAAIAMALTLLVMLVAIGWAMAWAISTLIAAIPGYVPQIQLFYAHSMAWLVVHGVSATTVNRYVTEFDPTRLIPALTGVLGSISGAVGAAAIVVSTILMLLIDSLDWKARMAMAAVGHSRAIGAMRDFAKGTRRYWLVSMIFGVIMALLNGIGLIALNEPLVGVWVVLTFVTTFIPSVGFFFAMVPPVVVAFLAHGWQNALWLMIIYFITTWIVQGIFQPKFIGDAVGVNITVSFISLLFWAWVFGPLGAIIALPATQLVKSLVIDADPKSRWLNALVASRPSVAGADPQT